MRQIIMFNKPLTVILSSLLLLMVSCNADSKSKSVTPAPATKSVKAGESIPQPGGYSNIDNAKLQQLLDQGVTLVDIRLKEEWQQTGVIKGSKTITFFDQTGRINPNFISEFTKTVTPDQPVALICRTGNRTQAASQAIAQQLGYKNVKNVTHGIVGWMSEKRAVVKYAN